MRVGCRWIGAETAEMIAVPYDLDVTDVCQSCAALRLCRICLRLQTVTDFRNRPLRSRIHEILQPTAHIASGDPWSLRCVGFHGRQAIDPVFLGGLRAPGGLPGESSAVA